MYLSRFQGSRSITYSLESYCKKHRFVGATTCHKGVPDEEVTVYPPVGYGYNIPWWEFEKLYVKENPERDVHLNELMANNKYEDARIMTR